MLSSARSVQRATNLRIHSSSESSSVGLDRPRRSDPKATAGSVALIDEHLQRRLESGPSHNSRSNGRLTVRRSSSRFRSADRHAPAGKPQTLRDTSPHAGNVRLERTRDARSHASGQGPHVVLGAVCDLFDAGIHNDSFRSRARASAWAGLFVVR